MTKRPPEAIVSAIAALGSVDLPHVHWSPGKVRVLGRPPPCCANWDYGELYLSERWGDVTCSGCIERRDEIERMWV